MPEATILLYGAVVLVPLVLCAIELRSAVARWHKEAEIESRLRARRMQRAMNPLPYLSLVAGSPRGEATLRRRQSAA